MSIFQLAAIFLFQLRNLLSAVQPRPSAAYGMTPDSCCLLWPPAAPMPAKEQQQAVTSHNTHMPTRYRGLSRKRLLWLQVIWGGFCLRNRHWWRIGMMLLCSTTSMYVLRSYPNTAQGCRQQRARKASRGLPRSYLLKFCHQTKGNYRFVNYYWQGPDKVSGMFPLLLMQLRRRLDSTKKHTYWRSFTSEAYKLISKK